ncbi:hypothetical protein [Yoonia sp. 2307UL14-13]|uniref:hypothetical protein n=1 Tax=Yoonia sp. 2307UL14-13 TaxID=3126506 RepID=UPI0030A29D5E
MKSLILATATIFLLAVGFFAWTWRYPLHIGWQGEMPVGYYRFQVVTYQTADYGHRNNVGVFSKVGTTADFFQYVTGIKKPADFQLGDG